MKKIVIAIALVAVAFAFVGCNSTPPATTPQANPQMAPKVYPPQVIEHKGTWAGLPLPDWIGAALSGPRDVEKLPDWKDKYVVIAEADAANKEAADLLASKMGAASQIAGYLSTRVKDTFAGAQVGDKDKLATYFERVVKTVAEATFTGFTQDKSWWVFLQTYTPDGKADKQIYRVLQIWSIDKAMLQKQLDKILDDAKADVAKTPEEQKAVDLVQKSFYDGF